MMGNSYETIEIIFYLLSVLRSIRFSLGVRGGSLEKYGWLRHCDAVNRMLGSNTRIDRNRDMASFGAAVKISSKGIAGVGSHVSPLAGNGNALWSGQLVLLRIRAKFSVKGWIQKKLKIQLVLLKSAYSFGVPNTMKIVSSCDISEFLPWRNGRRSSNSAKIHPTLHISAAEEYSDAPSNSSGGLYLSTGENYYSSITDIITIMRREKIKMMMRQ